MTLSLVNTTYNVAPNTLNDVIDSLETVNSPSWRVSDCTAGTLVNLGTGTNTSDVGYNPFTKRFMFCRNNFENFSEISEADIVNSVASPTIIRVVTVNGMFNGDIEGITNVFPNISEGGYELFCCIEDGGRNFIYNSAYTESDQFSTGNITITVRQELIMAPTAPDSNNGAEGVDYNIALDEITSVQEGQAAGTPTKIFSAPRPTDRDTDFNEATDIELDVSEPFDLDAVIPAGDASSVIYHTGTNHWLILSHTGNAVYQYDRAGTLIDTLNFTGITQAEGICMHGDNLIIMGEVDECVYYTYTAP